MQNEQDIIQSAIDLAEQWQRRASQLVNDFDKKFHKKMKKMLAHPKDKALMIELLDQSFRAESPKRVADQIMYLFEKHGMAHFFTSADRALLWGFKTFGGFLPSLSIPLFVKQIRDESRNVVIKGETEALSAHLSKRKAEGVRCNVNLIGEVVLGEQEAEERIQKYMKALTNPDIDYISIKISTIFSQIAPLDFDTTVDILVEKLTRIYQQAQKFPTINKLGEQENKFINLDMEEYRDLAITVELFKKTLDKPEFKDFKAGIVLQAYLPDSHLWQQNLTEWAKKRVADGGAPIKVRLVKGANMEMEETESQHRGWEVAPYTEKIDTDSNYKKMIKYALQPENAKAVHIGAASHNLFELAFAHEVAKANGTLQYFVFEMLEGMAESARLAINEISGEVLLYAPTATMDQFTNAIAYLVRRLDENTGPDNFIRYSFGLKVGTPDWERQKMLFKEAFDNEDKIFIGAKRTQNRLTENWDNFKNSSFQTGKFTSESDTDFVLPANQEWARNIRDKWKKSLNDTVETSPVVIAGKDCYEEGRDVKDAIDKSQLKEGVIVGKFTLASGDDLQEAVATAKADPDGWRKLSHAERHEALCKVAVEFRKKRGDLIGVAAAEVGKVFMETDVEVSEAIDFLEFYPHSIRYFDNYSNLEFDGRGVGVVIPPWNFPIAIPVGGIAAALAAGNCVIVKPASVAVLCAYELCKCFWDAGISKNVLQFAPCPGALAGEHLVAHKDVDFVILTGGEDTAYKMLKTRNDLFLSAETGGKDATIVTNLADRDQAVKNVCHSAFSNSGQKCSATSLLILEDEVYYDKNFRKALVDTANSMNTGSVWDFKNRIGTLANKVSGPLKKAINSLDRGEKWALEPSFADDNEYMLRPSIRWGVKEGNFCHHTELFGPVLSVMKAKNLKHAVDMVNCTGYGLTSGIESLDEREVNYWKKNIKAGNLYINRGTTGAIVLRQPFGGMGKSAVGANRKAGGYNYVSQFVQFKETGRPSVAGSYTHKLSDLVQKWHQEESSFGDDFEKLTIAVQSYLENYHNEFSVEKDYIQIRGEDNHFRYLPLSRVKIRVCKDDSLFEVLSRICAAYISGVSYTVALLPGEETPVENFLRKQQVNLFSGDNNLVVQTDEEFCADVKEYDRVIYSAVDKIPESVFAAAAKNAIFVVRMNPMVEGRIELLNYFIEQSISHSYHRYGNIGERGIKE